MKHGKGNSTNTGEDKFKQPASRRSSLNNKNYTPVEHYYREWLDRDHGEEAAITWSSDAAAAMVMACTVCTNQLLMGETSSSRCQSQTDARPWFFYPVSPAATDTLSSACSLLNIFGQTNYDLGPVRTDYEELR